MTTGFWRSKNTETVRETTLLCSSRANRTTAVAAVSGVGGATLRTFDVVTGDLLSELRLHSADTGRLLEPDTTGLSLAFDSATDSQLYVLSNGKSVRRVDADTGLIRWSWSERSVPLCVYIRAPIAASLTHKQVPKHLLCSTSDVQCSLRHRPRENCYFVFTTHHGTIINRRDCFIDNHCALQRHRWPRDHSAVEEND